jgi:hypothetical protein
VLTYSNGNEAKVEKSKSAKDTAKTSRGNNFWATIGQFWRRKNARRNGVTLEKQDEAEKV